MILMLSLIKGWPGLNFGGLLLVYGRTLGAREDVSFIKLMRWIKQAKWLGKVAAGIMELRCSFIESMASVRN